MHTRSQKKTKIAARIVTYLILIFAAVVCLFPFIWMISTSFKPMSDIYKMPPSLIPEKITVENFVEGWKGASFQMYFKNTAIITFLATIGTVLSSSVVAYGFARFQSRMSKVLFMVLLGTMMLPSQVTLIPQYLLYYKMGMLDTFWPLIIPSWLGGGAFNIFLFIQFFRTLPKELDEAAKIDGANSFQVFARILLPSVKPVMLAVLVMALVYNWNDFFNPLIYLNSNEKFTIAIGLQFFKGSQGNVQIGQMMSMALISLLPVLVIFATCQKYFIQGIKMSGLKG
ncbi:carbohydrate ABC transporter permease [Anaerocolumna sp. MB42-C2]|uniref:carbohydrate ABC transporter permease n=1 Tax=Anaerocolumna sp. MB42-C2 TaxID=3070997 RepID=UPI0027DFBD5F|nr:carbohydrate ABC transporter permease [Anaerocolumna sp. MB42-C2]WMJ89057.1 carbohydrate ABC transporter permease [Anaerocolumna sp. MB42-C2]